MAQGESQNASRHARAHNAGKNARLNGPAKYAAAKHGGRKAAAVDPELKNANRHRLRRIEGQIRGLQKMVEEDRYCPEIIAQIASVQEALRGVARSLMKNHLHHCGTQALRSGNPQKAEATYEELLELIYRHLR